MKKSAFISDLFFAFFTLFIFTLCLFRYLRMDLWLAFILSVICGLLTSGAVGAFLQSKRKHFFLKKSDEAQKQKLFLHLALLSDEEKTKYFQNALSSRLETPVFRFAKLKLYSKTNFYFLKFTIQPVTADEIAAFSRLKTSKQKTLYCLEIDESANTLCERLNVEVKTGADVYTLVKDARAIPDVFLGDQNGQKKPKHRLKLWFSKQNGKRFLTSGALILLASLLTPFAYYYLLFGGILLVLAAVVRIFGYE